MTLELRSWYFIWYCTVIRFSEHFERFRRHRPDRADITIEMCEHVKGEPMKTEDQNKGRTAYWGHVPEKERYLKVIVEPDSEEIVTAHCDRGFRREGEGGQER